MLRLKLFGTGEATYQGQLIEGFPTQQPCILLCYLAIQRRNPIRREQVADSFWPDDSGVSSRKKLSQTLWRLRRSFRKVEAPFEQFVIAESETLAFLDSNHIWLDIEHFETTIESTKNRHAKDLTPEQVAHLDQVTQLYTGDLLEAFDYEWCLNQRVFLSDLYYKTLKKLMDYHIAGQRHEAAIDYGHRLLAYDNTHEHIHQDMMRLYWLIGDRRAAITQYKMCAQILHDECAVPPMAQTEALYQLMVQGSYDPMNQGALYPPVAAPPITIPTSSRDQIKLLFRKLRALKVKADETRQEIQQIEQILQGIMPESS